MLITKVEVQKKRDNRVNIYVDDEFYCGVSLELAVKEHLKSGLEINKEELDRLILDDEKSVALNKAVKYISNNLKTIKQIREYLTKKEYNPITIEFVLAKLDEYNYLDDENYAKSYILTYKNKYGKLRLISNLKSKGISPKIIDKVFEENVFEGNIEDVANKYMKNKDVTYDNLMKLNRFLCSRGYEFDEIKKIINNFRGE